MIQETQLRGILDTIEGTDYSQVSAMELLKEHAFKLQQWMAFSGQQMAECKEALHDARRKAMMRLVSSLEANRTMLSPTLQKEYVNDACSKENMHYTLAERCNLTCTHAVSLCVTCISALKVEMEMNR